MADDPLAAVLAEFDIDGPYEPDHTRAAAGAVAELVRYLNHATLPHRTEQALTHPADAAAVLHSLSTALSRLPQLLNQIAGHLNRDIDGYGADDGAPARAVATAVAEATTACGYLDVASERIRRAAHVANRLYIRDT